MCELSICIITHPRCHGCLKLNESKPKFPKLLKPPNPGNGLKSKKLPKLCWKISDPNGLLLGDDDPKGLPPDDGITGGLVCLKTGKSPSI
jgi:hypothetical protein